MKNTLPKTFSKAAITLDNKTIEGIDEPTIFHYFETLNAGSFEQTSQLFALEGMLQPPFEAMIIGSEAIAAYLHQEAKGFVLLPQQGHKVLDSDDAEFLVAGRVQTPWFTVNVSWTFILNSNQQIMLAKVNLLASLQELMHMRH
ncbi:ketosteroid isomerase family protein [Leptolyngbyaceae cyanobacterium UHCC 1019]